MNFKKKGLFALAIIIGLTQFSCNKKFNQLQKKGTLEEKYAAAIKYYEDADYYKAGLIFEEITPLLKGDSTAEKAQFYATYNNSPFAEEAFYMYAYSMFKDSPPSNLDQTNTLTAIDALQTFINTYPDSKYAEKCNKDLNDLRNRLEKKAYEKAKLYYKTRQPSYGGLANYKATVVSVGNFLKDFPDSKYREELQYIQVIAQQELADVSLFTKQKERYNEAITLYEKFIDKYPKSKYLKDLEKVHARAMKGLEEVDKTEKAIEQAKIAAEKEKS